MAASEAPNLLTIPLEVRILIFKKLFQSLNVRIGYRRHTNHNTSLLQTCRQLHDEAQPIVLPNCLFQFASTFLMVDTLTKLPSTTISQIRHIRVRGSPFPLHPAKDDSEPEEFGWWLCASTASDYGPRTFFFEMAHTLSLFPGLHLDRLIVEDVIHDSLRGFLGQSGHVTTYNEIGALVQQDGWKELWYLTPTTEFIESGLDKQNVRVQQPDGWDKAIKNKDGVDSGAECTMYVGPWYEEECDEGVQDDPDYIPERTWEVVDPKSRSAWIGLPNRSSHLTDRDFCREVLVVVKRGRNASYVNDGKHCNKEFGKLFNKMSWEEIKKSDLYVSPEEYCWS